VLCLVSDRRAIGGRALVQLVGEAARAGVDLIQIRERDLDDGALVALARAAVAAVHGTSARVIVNDRTDVALAAGAAGVHLRSDSIPPRRARAMAGDGFLVGRSVHDEAEAAAVDAEGGCDYLIFGTVFPSSSKPAGSRDWRPVDRARTGRGACGGGRRRGNPVVRGLRGPARDRPWAAARV
jgi:thiamine-phosphate pyrophosphorylase